MNDLSPATRLIGIGWYVVVCIVGGLLGGVYLDKWLGISPALTMVGLFLGLLLAFYGGYQMLMETLRDSNKSAEE